MSEWIDHAAEARGWIAAVARKRPGATEGAMLAVAEGVLALVEQQRIANRLEYARLAIERYGNYAPTGANLPSLFLPPETEQGNVRVSEDIARALRIGDDRD